MEKPREYLARHLRELMKQTPALDTQTKVANKSGLSQSTVQRVLAKEQSATVDVLDDLARAFDISPPRYFLLEKEERDLLRRFVQLRQEDKSRIMAFIDVAAQSSQKDTSQSNKLSFSSVRNVPPEMHGALDRASGRKPPSPTTKQDTDVKTPQAGTKKRRKA